MAILHTLIQGRQGGQGQHEHEAALHGDRLRGGVRRRKEEAGTCPEPPFLWWICSPGVGTQVLRWAQCQAFLSVTHVWSLGSIYHNKFMDCGLQFKILWIRVTVFLGKIKSEIHFIAAEVLQI